MLIRSTGGIISERTTWRWIFYLNVPIGGAIFIILFFAWPSAETKHVAAQKAGAAHKSWYSLAKYLKYFDFQGLIMLAAGSVLLIVGLQTGGSDISTWSSAVVVTTLTLSATCFVSLAFWIWLRDRRFEKTKIPPLFPLRILRRRMLSAAFL